MKKNQFYIKGIFFLCSITILGCKKLELSPENEFTDLTYWSSEDKAQTVLNTAYSQMFSSNYFFYNEAASDNAYNGRGDNAGVASLAAGTYDPSLGRINAEWNERYAGIKTTNLLLENIDQIPELDEERRQQMIAEARFLRAFQHFQLITWFGDIPLVDQDLTIEEAQTISRTSRNEVLQFILDELDAVEDILPANTEYSIEERGKITSGAAVALKARVQLYEGNWEAVITETEKLMHDNEYGTYGLFPSYSGLFLPENQYSEEDILSLQFVREFRTWGEFFDFAPLSAGARLNAMAPTQELVDSYIMENGEPIEASDSGYDEDNPYQDRDPRLTHTVVYHEYEWENPDGSTHTIYIEPGSDPDEPLDEYAPGSSATPTGYYLRKYFDPEHQTALASSINLMLIRYADVLLMNAEAKAEHGTFGESTWNETIRSLRERAGFTDPNALNFENSLSQNEIIEVVRNERRTELAMEGLRIFDIRRWEIAEDFLNGWVHGARFGPASEDGGYIRVNERTFDPSKHYLWPIPRDERLINDNLTQNPGW